MEAKKWKVKWSRSESRSEMWNEYWLQARPSLSLFPHLDDSWLRCVAAKQHDATQIQSWQLANFFMLTDAFVMGCWWNPTPDALSNILMHIFSASSKWLPVDHFIFCLKVGHCSLDGIQLDSLFNILMQFFSHYF